MRAFVTSINEATTKACCWSLQRNGFEVELVEGGDLLVDKLKTIYEQADDHFVRVDADVVVNKSFTPELIEQYLSDKEWWFQFMTFDWLKLDHAWGGVQLIKREALPHLRKHVDKYREADRPETMLSRIPEFYSPRRFISVDEFVVGLHGYKAAGDERIYRQKSKRKHFEKYDFELAKRLEEI